MLEIDSSTLRRKTDMFASYMKQLKEEFEIFLNGGRVSEGTALLFMTIKRAFGTDHDHVLAYGDAAVVYDFPTVLELVESKEELANGGYYSIGWVEDRNTMRWTPDYGCRIRLNKDTAVVDALEIVTPQIMGIDNSGPKKVAFCKSNEVVSILDGIYRDSIRAREKNYRRAKAGEKVEFLVS